MSWIFLLVPVLFIIGMIATISLMTCAKHADDDIDKMTNK